MNVLKPDIPNSIKKLILIKLKLILFAVDRLKSIVAKLENISAKSAKNISWPMLQRIRLNL